MKSAVLDGFCWPQFGLCVVTLLALYEIEKGATQWAIQKGGFEYYLVTVHFLALSFQRLSELADRRPEGEATWD